MDVEEYAVTYHQFYTGEIPRLLLKYLSEVSWKSFLDLGCGDGALLYTLNRRGYFSDKVVYAVDLSESRINLVRKISGDFRCFVDDACRIQNIEDNSIDFLVSTSVIEHVSDDEAMVKEMDRVLSRGGLVYLSTIFKKWYGWYFHRRNGRWVLDPTHVREYSRDAQLLNIFERHKLEVVEMAKSPSWYPLIEPILRAMGAKNSVFSNRFLRFLRSFKIPIPGYYKWNIVCKKKNNSEGA